MQFKSIITLFRHLEIEVASVDPTQLPRIKKVVMAEFAMADDGIIEIEQQTYNKQEVLEILDAPNTAELIAIYRKIEAHQAFAQFIEKGIYDAQGLNDEIPDLEKDNQLVRITSPYLAFHFNRKMKEFLQEEDFIAASMLVPVCAMILIADREKAFQSTEEFLETSIYEIRNTNKTTFPTKRAQFNKWTKDWAEFLNHLPDELIECKTALGIRLITLTVELQYLDKWYVYMVSSQLTRLQFMDPENTRLIEKNHKIYEQKAAQLKRAPKELRKKFRKKRKLKTWHVVVLIIIIVRMISSNPNWTFHSKKTTRTALNEISESKNFMITQKFIKQAQESLIKLPLNTFTLEKKAYPILKNPVAVTFLHSINKSYKIFIHNKTNINYVLYLPLINDSEYVTLSIGGGESSYFIYTDNKCGTFFIAYPHYDEPSPKILMNTSFLVYKAYGTTANDSIRFIDTATVTSIKAPKDYSGTFTLEITANKGIHYISSPDVVWNQRMDFKTIIENAARTSDRQQVRVN